MEKNIFKIQQLVGPITDDQLYYVDSYTSDIMGVYIPISGPCFYAISPEHHHPSYMFVLSLGSTNQIKLPYHKVITLESGQMLGLAPYIKHQELPKKENPNYMAIFINKDFFNKQGSFYSHSFSNNNREDPLQKGLVFEAPALLIPLIKEFIMEIENQLPGSTEVLSSLAIRLVHHLIRSMHKLNLDYYKVPSRLNISEAIEYMHMNMGKKIYIKELARVANLSPSHFNKIFRKEIGKSPYEYLMEIRLARVKKLLLQKDRSITAIALECGFNDSSSLSTCFYKNFHCAPSQFRKQFEKSNL